MAENEKEYIWHCPAVFCLNKGIILMKTNIPFLGDGKIKCPNCGKLYTFREVMKANKKNIEGFLEDLSRSA